jgi:hypothetical protein
MNDYFNTFQTIEQSVEQLLTGEQNSLEIEQSATSLRKSVQPCIEELKQSSVRLKQLVQVGFDDLYNAENVWLSKPRIAEAAKEEIWEQLGDISGRSIRIRNLANQCREDAVKQAKKYWNERIDYSREKWFIDSKRKPKEGIGWGEKDGFIREIPPKSNSLLVEVDKIIKSKLSKAYEEMTQINLELMHQYIKLLEQQQKIKYGKQIVLIFSDVGAKLSKPTEHLPKSVTSLKTIIRIEIKALVGNGWGDIFGEDVVKFKERVASKIERFITAIFDDRVELATKAITKAIAFYNYFLERQDRYQQETPEQREAEKAWIDQQRRELERVQQGIEVILNTN